MSTDFTAQSRGPVPVAPYAQPVVVGDKYLNMSATGTVKTGEGWMAGLFVNSSTSGTLKLYDMTAASGLVICNTFTPALGWNPIPIHFSNGLHMVLTGTMDWTVVYS